MGLQAFLVGIVVPDPEVMPSWAQKRGIEGTYAELCANKVGTMGLSPERLWDLLRRCIMRRQRNSRLAKLEHVGRFLAL